MTDDYAVLILEDTVAAAKLMTGLVNEIMPMATVCHQPTLEQALTCLPDKSWCLFLVDLGLPDGSGIEFITRARRQFPDVPFVVMTVFDDDDNLFGALAAGATGYLLKSQPREQLVQQLTLMRAGHVPMSPSIARRMLQYFQDRTVANGRLVEQARLSTGDTLTAREREVLGAIARGMRNREVADLLGLTEQTVSTYVRNLYAKLNINNRAQAALAAQQHGLL